MKRYSLHILLATVACACISLTIKTTSPTSTQETNTTTDRIEQEDSSKIEDILDIVNAINGEGMPKPPTEFKKGHVNPTSNNASVTKTDNGFVIKLPSNNGVPTPTFDNGKLYASGGFGSRQYFAFDPITGEQKWGMDLDDDGPSSGVVEDGILVYNTESCTIFACDQETGEQKWSYFLGDPLMSTPTISNGVVFTAYPAHGNFNVNPKFQEITKGKFKPSHVLIAMDLHDGKILWQKWIDGDIIMAPVAKDGELHLVSFPGTYYVVDQQSGEFSSAQRMRGTSAPTFGDNGVVMSRRSDNEHFDGVAKESIVTYSAERSNWEEGYKREAEYLDHKVQAKSQLKMSSNADDAGNGFAGGAPASSGAQYAQYNVGQSNVSSLQSFMGSRTLNRLGSNYNTMGDTVVCTDEETGEMKWKYGIAGNASMIGGFIGTAPITVGDNILIATHGGEVVILDAKTGEQKKSYSTGESIRTTPIAVNGWIYVGTSNGKIIGINTNDKSITGWPMMGKNVEHTNS